MTVRRNATDMNPQLEKTSEGPLNETRLIYMQAPY